MAFGDLLRKASKSNPAGSIDGASNPAAENVHAAANYHHHVHYQHPQQPQRQHAHAHASGNGNGNTLAHGHPHHAHALKAANAPVLAPSEAGSSSGSLRSAGDESSSFGTIEHSSTASSTSSSHNLAAAARAHGVVHKGYLLHKKGVLKRFERAFYFVTARSSDLFSFKDELQFDEWLRLGLPLRAVGSSKASALMPTLVCSVLRADRAGDASAIDRAIAVIAGDLDKCSSYKFVASSAESCEQWIQAFHRVQITRRDERRGGGGGGSGVPTSAGPSGGAPLAALHAHAARPHASSASLSDPYGSSDLNMFNPRMSDVSDVASHHSAHRKHSNGSGSSGGNPAAPPAPSSGGSAASPPNVVLFVPAAGSSISLSDSKLAEARTELRELVARGAKRPVRGGMDHMRGVTWRYGLPEYALSDLEYVKGKTRDHDATPLESYAETCCQTFLMEAAHKAVYSEWTSVRQDYFYVQVNDGAKIPGRDLQEHDLFGMLYVNDVDVAVDLREGDERKDPRAILAEAFTQGFPMEVLDVFTQPPQCHFSWRHWGRFTGRYKGVRGDGRVIELRGFGKMHIDEGRMLNLQLFFKQRELFDLLSAAAQEITQDHGVALGIPVAGNPNCGSTSASTSTRTPTARSTRQPSTSSASTTSTTSPPSTGGRRPASALTASSNEEAITDRLIGEFMQVNIVAPPRANESRHRRHQQH